MSHQVFGQWTLWTMSPPVMNCERLSSVSRRGMEKQADRSVYVGDGREEGVCPLSIADVSFTWWCPAAQPIWMCVVCVCVYHRDWRDGSAHTVLAEDPGWVLGIYARSVLWLQLWETRCLRPPRAEALRWRAHMHSHMHIIKNNKVKV